MISISFSVSSETAFFKEFVPVPYLLKLNSPFLPRKQCQSAFVINGFSLIPPVVMSSRLPMPELFANSKLIQVALQERL